MMTRVKTADEINAMRESGKMLAVVLEKLEVAAQAGMSTKDLAEIAKKELKPLGGLPAFLGYQGFPDVLCVSVNNEIVHGIPSRQRVIADGDIVSMDFGVNYHGMITDSATTVIIGSSNQKVQNLVAETQQSLEAGIQVIRAGVQIGDIGHAVQQVLDTKKYGIIKDLVGHGVGHALHEDPNIPNTGRRGRGFKLEAGMTIAVEPMASLGSDDIVMEDDGWTISTRDGSLAAHFEHTILVTEDSAEVLTRRTSE